MPVVLSLERIIQSSKEERLLSMHELSEMPVQVYASQERILVRG